jgi:dynein heavy chain 2
MIQESILLKWKSEGLPGDSLSLENSVMIFNTSKTPLIIDPNSKATLWLKTHFKEESNLEIISHTHPKF